MTEWSFFGDCSPDVTKSLQGMELRGEPSRFLFSSKLRFFMQHGYYIKIKCYAQFARYFFPFSGALYCNLNLVELTFLSFFCSEYRTVARCDRAQFQYEGRKCPDTRKKRVEGTPYTIRGGFALATCKLKAELRVVKFKILIFLQTPQRPSL